MVNKNIKYLISTHMPKAGGTSFKKFLVDNYKDKVYLDYDRKDFTQTLIQKEKKLSNKIKNTINEKNIYHGHFCTEKYNIFESDRRNYFITWLRNPLDRLISHYYYTHQTYNPKNPNLFHKIVIEQNWSLMDFCLSIYVKNIYFQYLGNFNIDRLNFIGIFEYYNEDFNYLTKNILNLSNITLPNINKTTKNKSVEFNKIQINKIKEFHSKDYDLYNYALTLRSERV